MEGAITISGTSFWQQDQNWQLQQQSWDQQLGNANSLSSVLTSALTDQTTGLASIANQQALARVNSQISTALTSALGTSASAGATSGAAANSGTASSGAASSPSSASSPQATLTDSILQSGAVNFQSAGTAASLLAGEIPAGSLLSILA
jgi:hypothetical protein